MKLMQIMTFHSVTLLVCDSECLTYTLERWWPA